MVVENPTSGAPRIHGEPLMLGFDLCERTISRWMKRAPRDPEPAKRCSPSFETTGKRLRPWTSSPCQQSTLTCSIASLSSATAVDASCTSTSPSIRLACGSCNSCENRFRLSWLLGFLFSTAMRSNGLEVLVAVRSLKMSPVRTSFESPWQNGVAERWVESCRRDLLDHVIAVNERHLKRLLSEYVRYYHEDRTHLGLRKGTPDYRIRSTASGRVLSEERLGGLHHRYVRAA